MHVYLNSPTLRNYKAHNPRCKYSVFQNPSSNSELKGWRMVQKCNAGYDMDERPSHQRASKRPATGSAIQIGLFTFWWRWHYESEGGEEVYLKRI